MTKAIARKTIFAVALGWALAASGQAAAEGCDTNRVAGIYGMNFDGFPAEVKANGDTRIFLDKRERAVGRLNLKGDQTVAVSLRGFLVEPSTKRVDGPIDVAFAGTWSVAADCTGEIDLIEFDKEVDWLFVAVADGSELFILSGASLGQAQAKRIDND